MIGERIENYSDATDANEENSKEQAETIRQGKRARIKRDQEREEENKHWKQPQGESQQHSESENKTRLSYREKGASTFPCFPYPKFTGTFCNYI